MSQIIAGHETGTIVSDCLLVQKVKIRTWPRILAGWQCEKVRKV
jgi:hypothetical protein